MPDYIKIIEFDNGIQANMLESALKERNIPFIIRSYHDSAYDGIFQIQLGWGCLEAPPEFENEIKIIFSDLTKNESV